jgi:hypothetical protein
VEKAKQKDETEVKTAIINLADGEEANEKPSSFQKRYR